MASGRLAFSVPATATSTTIYIPATGITATVNINAVNIIGTASKVRLQLAATASISNLTDAMFIEHDQVLDPSGAAQNVLERTAVVVAYNANAPGGNGIVAYSDTGGVAFGIWGIEA